MYASLGEIERIIGGPIPDAEVAYPLDQFRNGDVLESVERKARMLVINSSADGETATLMPLHKNEHEIFEARLEEMEGWGVAYLAGPRFVQVRGIGSKDILWSTYLPDFESACALWRALRDQQPQKYDAQIFAQHVDELEALDIEGYFTPADQGTGLRARTRRIFRKLVAGWRQPIGPGVSDAGEYVPAE